LDMSHTLRGECAQEEKGKGMKPKVWMWLMCLLWEVNKIILNWQRPLWEGNFEEVWQRWTNLVVIHTCIDEMLGISLYRCLCLKLAKRYVFLIISTKLENKKLNRFCPVAAVWGGGSSNVYTFN
jgi:hypothetical protein